MSKEFHRCAQANYLRQLWTEKCSQLCQPICTSQTAVKPLFLTYSIPLAYWHIQMGHICLGQFIKCCGQEHVHINTMCNNITHSFRLTKHIIHSILRNSFKQSPPCTKARLVKGNGSLFLSAPHLIPWKVLDAISDLGNLYGLDQPRKTEPTRRWWVQSQGKNVTVWSVRVETTNFACHALRGNNTGISTMITFTVSIYVRGSHLFVHHRLAVAHWVLRSPQDKPSPDARKKLRSQGHPRVSARQLSTPITKTICYWRDLTNHSAL